MKTCLKQEFYKLLHKKMIWIIPIILLLLMIFAAFSLSAQENRLLAMDTYFSDNWIMLLLIITASTIFSMEFQNNAILTLLYKAPHKSEVYLAKIIVIFVYNLALHVLAIIFTLLLKAFALGGLVDWTATYQYQQPLWLNMLHTSFLDLIASTLIISLIFLVSCLINNNAVVIAVNLGIFFMGGSLSADWLRSGSRWLDLIKWNPLNMTNLVTQYYNYPVYHQTSHLNNLQLLTGSLAYIFFFLILGYLIFKKKRF